MIKRIITNLFSDDLEACKRFYVELLDVAVVFESDWYVQFQVNGDAKLEFAVLLRNHELVPDAYRKLPAGMFMTFVVDDVDATYHRAISMEAEIVQAPVNEFYGQRRCLVKDPSGCLVDISSPIKA